MSNLRLIVSYGGRARRFALPVAPSTLGSAESNDLVVPFPGVSKQHAVVHPHPEGLRVIDSGSKNGLVIAGERVEDVVLRIGQRLLLGRAFLSLQEAESEEGGLALRLHSSDSTETTDLVEARRSMPDASSPSAALQLIRKTERMGSLSGVQRTNLLGEARLLLGARSLCILGEPSDGQPTVIDCSGELVPGPMLQVISLHLERIPAGRHDAVLVAVEPASAALLAVPEERGPCVALVDGLPSAIAPWQGDLLLYIAEKLGAARQAAASSVQRRREDAPQRQTQQLVPPPGMVLGGSPAMSGLLNHLRAAASSSDLNVLLLGETGTGKELFARMIHASGEHASGPFVAINCAAIPAELLEAELFGISGRVATGVDARPGLFLQANGGAILLDEISEMADRLQAKLLRVLQEREVLAVGGAEAKRIQVQVISTSNRDLERRVREGSFRADLYYRLRGLQFHIPPLRERREDIPQLVAHFANRAAHKYGRRVEGVSRSALEILSAYDWPGNVRELENEVERAVLLCDDGGALRKEHFGGVEHRLSTAAAGPKRADGGDEGSPDVEGRPGVDARSPAVTADSLLQEQVDEVERQAILRALAKTGGNKTRAAELLGITRNGLALKIKRLGIGS